MKASLGPESAREAEPTNLVPKTETPAAEMSEAAKVHQVYNWILGGASDFDVIEAMHAAWPGESIKPLLKAAVRKMQEAASIDAATVVGFCFAATHDLYRRMVEIGDFTGALKALKQLETIATKYGSLAKEQPNDSRKNTKPAS
jgi:hypothetical protein